MQLHNPTNTSRLCYRLGLNVEAYEAREVPESFEKCDGCRCVVSGASDAKADASKDAKGAE